MKERLKRDVSDEDPALPFHIFLNVLTELWAELRQRARHELTGLVLTHNVGDLLSAAL